MGYFLGLHFFDKCVSSSSSELGLGQSQFLGLEFGISGGFGRVHCSVLVDKPGFERVQSSVFPDLGLGLAHF